MAKETGDSKNLFKYLTSDLRGRGHFVMGIPLRLALPLVGSQIPA